MFENQITRTVPSLKIAVLIQHYLNEGVNLWYYDTHIMNFIMIVIFFLLYYYFYLGAQKMLI
jgi:hypothetical protein